MSKSNDRIIAYSCKYYIGDRPCKWHKIKGVVCECEHFSPIKGKILIIKLDAVGDVLRTTCLLPGISRKWPDMNIVWVTRKEAKPLLENNQYLSELLIYNGEDTLTNLLSTHYEKVVNLDAGRVSSSLASIVNANEKIGYVLNPRGYVEATNDAAENWLKMGVFDDLKKQNDRTYQEIMSDIVGISSSDMNYVFDLSHDELMSGVEHLEALGVDLEKKIVGIHTGGGGRWTRKQWEEDSFVNLIRQLRKELGGDIQFLLFGGPLEEKRNNRISKTLGKDIFHTGYENSLRHFAALVANCSLMLSGDTLAMHTALAMKRRVVVLFGPTSSAEIELFDRGEKIVPDLDCLVCYLKTCEVSPYCMQLISVEMVKEAIIRQLECLSKPL